MEETNVSKQPPQEYLIKWDALDAEKGRFPPFLVHMVTKLTMFDERNVHVINELIREWYKRFAEGYTEKDETINPYFHPSDYPFHPSHRLSSGEDHAWPCTPARLASHTDWVNKVSPIDERILHEFRQTQCSIYFASLGDLRSRAWLQRNPWGYRQAVFVRAMPSWNSSMTPPDWDKVEKIRNAYQTLSQDSENASKALLDKVLAFSERHPITNIVAFGLGIFDDIAETEERTLHFRTAYVYQHDFVIRLRKKLESKHRRPVELVLQDLSYKPEAKEFLESQNRGKVTIATHPEGLTHIGSSTLVFWHTLDAGLPMAQILTELPRPAAIICDKIEKSVQINFFPEYAERNLPGLEQSERSKKMFDEYERDEVDCKLSTDRLGDHLKITGHKRQDAIDTVDLFVRK